MPTPIQNAETQTNNMNALSKKYEPLSKAIKTAVEAKPATVAAINTAADNALKAVTEWGTAVATAKKVQAEIDKIHGAEKFAKALKEATGKVEKNATLLKNEALSAEKISAKADDADSKLGKRLEEVLPYSQKALSGVQSYVQGGIGTEVLHKQMDELVQHKLPSSQTVRNTLKVTQTDWQNAGADITTAESAAKSLPPLIKQGLAAYLPDVKKNAQELQNVEAKLNEYISKARTKLGNDLKTINGVIEGLKKFK